MRLFLNIIWFVLAGFWIAIGYTFAALICFVLIVTIPFGIASLRIAAFALWPFGKTVVKIAHLEARKSWAPRLGELRAAALGRVPQCKGGHANPGFLRARPHEERQR
jgi:uncharacterized membrane protein YccF (DUF307 family)